MPRKPQPRRRVSAKGKPAAKAKRVARKSTDKAAIPAGYVLLPSNDVIKVGDGVYSSEKPKGWFWQHLGSILVGDTVGPRCVIRKDEVPIPRGWFKVDEGEEIWIGDAHWYDDNWRTVTEDRSINFKVAPGQLIIRRLPLKVTSHELKLTPEQIKARQRQEKMRQAVDECRDITIDEPCDAVEATTCGTLGERVTMLERQGIRGSITLTASAIHPEDLAKYLRENPIFNKRHLGYFAPGIPLATRVLAEHALRHMPDEDRQALYAQGGMQAVRDMALRLAKHELSKARRKK